MFFTNYHKAYNHAVDEARKYNREMQLRAGKEYSTKGYYVQFAVGERFRFGVDLQGEFIKPSDPKMEVRSTNRMVGAL